MFLRQILHKVLKEEVEIRVGNGNVEVLNIVYLDDHKVLNIVTLMIIPFAYILRVPVDSMNIE